MAPNYRPDYSYPGVDARNHKEAEEKLKKLMKERPDLFIKGAKDNSVPKDRSLVWRLITGK